MRPLPLGDFDPDIAREISEYIQRRLEEFVRLDEIAAQTIRDIEDYLVGREGDGE